jgi:hypothetical protein
MPANTALPTDRKRPNVPDTLKNDLPLKHFANRVDRARLRGILESSEHDSKWHRLLVAIQDPALSRFSLPRLLRELQIPLIDLMQKYREACTVEAHFVAQERLPEVMSGIVDDALPGEDVCPLCVGAKQIPDPLGRPKADGSLKDIDCPKCDATGKIRIPGQTDARKLVMQSEKMVESGSGAKQQVIVNNLAVPDLMQAIRVQEHVVGDGIVDVDFEEVAGE